jgi:hypothetical protein
MLKKKIIIVFITLIATMITTTIFGQTKPNPKSKVIRVVKNKVATKNAKQAVKPEEATTELVEEAKPKAAESTETIVTNDDLATKNRKGTRIGKTLRKFTKAAMPNRKAEKSTNTSVTPATEESSTMNSTTNSSVEPTATALPETTKTESTETSSTEESTESNSAEKKTITNPNKRKKIRRILKKIVANLKANSTENPTVKKPNE